MTKKELELKINEINEEGFYIIRTAPSTLVYLYDELKKFTEMEKVTDHRSKDVKEEVLQGIKEEIIRVKMAKLNDYTLMETVGDTWWIINENELIEWIKTDK